MANTTTGTYASIGPGRMPNVPPSQPCWKIAVAMPIDAPIDSRFMAAA
jgi:hypothetical protein